MTPAHFKNDEKCDGSKIWASNYTIKAQFENNTVENPIVTYVQSLNEFDAKEMYPTRQEPFSLISKALEMFLLHNFRVFTWCRFQNVPVRVPFSKSTVFKICRQKLCCFRVNGRHIRHIIHRFQNVPASLTGITLDNFAFSKYEL